MLPIRKILVGTDFSPHSDHAFAIGCSVARDYGAELELVHVVPVPMVVFGDGPVPPEPPGQRDRILAQLKKCDGKELRVGVKHRVVEGDAASELIRLARETKADLILVGTHGRTGLSRLLLGSVAEEVVRGAPCPVLTVKLPEAAAAEKSVGASR